MLHTSLTQFTVLACLSVNSRHAKVVCKCRRDNGLPFDEDLLYLRMESGDPTVLGSKWENSLYIAAGPDPFILVEKAVAAAAQLSGGAQQRQDKQQPDSLNWFGWCTWDAYYSKVSARGAVWACDVVPHSLCLCSVLSMQVSLVHVAMTVNFRSFLASNCLLHYHVAGGRLPPFVQLN